MNSSSQNTWPRYASPCSPRAGTPTSRPDRVVRDRLEHVEHVEVQRLREVAVGTDLDAGPSPDVAPAHHVAFEELVEVAGPLGEPSARLLARFAHRVVARRVQRDDLLDGDLVAVLDVDGELAGRRSSRPRRARGELERVDRRGTPGCGPPRAMRMCDWLVSTWRHTTSSLSWSVPNGTRCWSGSDRVPGDTAVAHRAVERAAHLEPPRPALGDEGRLEAREVRRRACSRSAAG